MNPSDLVHLDKPYAAFPQTRLAAKDIVVLALRSPTDYWPSLALSWIDRSLSIDTQIADLLIAVSQEKRFSRSQA